MIVDGVDLAVRVGSVELAAPVMTAARDGGVRHRVRAVLRPVDDRRGRHQVDRGVRVGREPGPRVHPTPQGMINAVGLQGPGIESWLAQQLPKLLDTGATVVCSIWGRSVDDYRRAADALADAPGGVAAVEVNLSCPNLEGRGSIFAHDAALSADVVAATAGCGRPRWAKLSPNTDRIVDVAAAVADAGAEAVTVANTLLGLVFDPETWRPALGNGGGGLSGRAVHPVAVRAVHDVHQALPELPIVGVGGVASGWDAIEFLLAGASAVQVGTASFADPRACVRVRDELAAIVAERGIHRVIDVRAVV
ncbi:MAG: dihydroorotate dehydrogenase [Ilumatobacteraceae bacterium]